MMAESAAFSWASQRDVALPPWASRPLAVLFLLFLGQHLFFAPATEDTDIKDRVLRAITAAFRAGFDRLHSWDIGSLVTTMISSS